MEFKDKVKELRKGKKLTQSAVAQELGITLRAYQYYEQGTNYPSNAILLRLAEIFEVTVDSLISMQDECLITVNEKGGNSRDKARIRRLTGEVTTMFVGGQLDDEDNDTAMRALTEAYWKAREMNKATYTPKKYKNRDKDSL